MRNKELSPAQSADFERIEQEVADQRERERNGDPDAIDLAIGEQVIQGKEVDAQLAEATDSARETIQTARHSIEGAKAAAKEAVISPGRPAIKPRGKSSNEDVEHDLAELRRRLEATI